MLCKSQMRRFHPPPRCSVRLRGHAFIPGQLRRDIVKRGLDAAHIRHRISHYDAEHAFMRDVGARFDPSATDAAFTEAIELFREL